MSDVAFQHSAQFEQGEVSGNLRLGKLESMYEELFADVIEDGIITAEERAQLDKMADSLGLDRARLKRLEDALQAAYEAKHRVSIREADEGEDRAGTLLPLEPASDPRGMALQNRVKFLEARVKELERALEEAQSQVAVDVDLSDVSGPSATAVPDDDAVELARILRHNPRDEETLHTFFRLSKKQGDADRALALAQLAVFQGIALPEEKEWANKFATGTLIAPKNSLTSEAWTTLLAHPDQEPLIGEIFSVVAPAVLLGRISAMRRDKQLPKLNPTQKQDVSTSTIQGVRCVAWGAALLGMAPPAIFVDPDAGSTMDLIPGMPVSLRIGSKALSGRKATELAFLAGQHLSVHRAEHLVRAIVPSVSDLEEIYLAALSIGNPGLPLAAGIKERVVPIAKAIEPIVEPAAVDRLRGHFLRFVEEGGRANLHRWAAAVQKTSTRAGLLLSGGDLNAAKAVITLEDPTHVDERMNDLFSFMASDRYSKLRKQLGIAVSN